MSLFEKGIVTDFHRKTPMAFLRSYMEYIRVHSSACQRQGKTRGF